MIIITADWVGDFASPFLGPCKSHRQRCCRASNSRSGSRLHPPVSNGNGYVEEPFIIANEHLASLGLLVGMQGFLQTADDVIAELLDQGIR